MYVFKIIFSSQIKSIRLKIELRFLQCANILPKMALPMTGILVHLGSRASGGAGLIIQEATSVSPEGTNFSRRFGTLERRTNRKNESD